LSLTGHRNCRAPVQALGRSNDALYHALAQIYEFGIANKDRHEALLQILREEKIPHNSKVKESLWLAATKVMFPRETTPRLVTQSAQTLAYAEQAQTSPSEVAAFIAREGGIARCAARLAKSRKPTPPPEASLLDPDDLLDNLRQSAVPISLPDALADKLRDLALIIVERSDDGSWNSLGWAEELSIIWDAAMEQYSGDAAGSEYRCQQCRLQSSRRANARKR
jgi:hypothetical protein